MANLGPVDICRKRQYNQMLFLYSFLRKIFLNFVWLPSCGEGSLLLYLEFDRTGTVVE